MSAFTIGEAAKRAGVNIETLRYYERRGLVPPPPRSHSNYRLYPNESVRLVRFVKRAQDLGFTLKEIKELLAFRNGVDASCGDVLEQALAKMRDIDDKMRALQAMRGSALGTRRPVPRARPGRWAHSRFPGHALTPTGVMAIRCKQFHLPDL